MGKGGVRRNTKREIDKKIIGKTIKKAKVDGSDVILEFTDGEVFEYIASDGGYSCFALYKKGEGENRV